MAECECLPGCVFFNDKMASIPTTAEMMKKRYCLGDNSKCARHMVKVELGSAKVPADLYPSQVERVPGILAAGR